MAGATDPSLNVVVTGVAFGLTGPLPVVTGRPGSFTVLSPTCAGTVTPAAESTHAFMLVMATVAMESRRAESAAATTNGSALGGRGGAIYVVT